MAVATRRPKQSGKISAEMKLILANFCPHCKTGRMMFDSSGEAACIQCGKRIYR